MLGRLIRAVFAAAVLLLLFRSEHVREMLQVLYARAASLMLTSLFHGLALSPADRAWS